jgi:ribosomal protein L24
MTKPIDVSKVGLLDTASKKAARIGYNTDAKGKTVRFNKKSGKEIK